MGRKRLSDEIKRKPRTIKLNDLEWGTFKKIKGTKIIQDIIAREIEKERNCE